MSGFNPRMPLLNHSYEPSQVSENSLTPRDISGSTAPIQNNRPMPPPRPRSSTAARMREMIERRRTDPTAPLLPSESPLAPFAPSYTELLRDEMTGHTLEKLQRLAVSDDVTKEVNTAAKNELSARELGVTPDYFAQKFNIEAGRHFDSFNALAKHAVNKSTWHLHSAARLLELNMLLEKDNSEKTAKEVLKSLGYSKST